MGDKKFPHYLRKPERAHLSHRVIGVCSVAASIANSLLSIRRPLGRMIPFGPVGPSIFVSESVLSKQRGLNGVRI